MPKALPSLLILILAFSGLGLYAQDEESPNIPSIDSEWDDYDSSPYSRGDKTFIISLGVLIPTYFSGIDDMGHGLSLGGTGSLAFNYFFTSHFFAGGELSGMFAGTRGKNMIYMVPFGVRIGYQFVFKRFEFPLYLMIGAAPQKYLEDGYFGIIFKPGASIFWRYNSDWSFGLNGVWWFVPQWPKHQDGIKHDAYGNFLELTLSARYHF